MNWQFLLAISVLTYSVSVLLQRILLKNESSDPIAYTIVFQLLNGLFIGIYALIHGFKLPPDLHPLLGNLVLTILLYGTANVFIFKALKETEASRFTVLFSTRALWTILAAVTFLGETFSPSQILGTGLILFGVVVVSWKTKGLSLGLGDWFSLIAAALFGLAFANDAFIIRHFDVPSYVSIAFILPAIFIWILNPKSTKKMGFLFESGLRAKMIILAIVYSISAITVFEAYNLGRNAAVIAPLNQMTIVVTVILAAVFLKEKAYFARKVVGALLSFIGVFLLS